MASIGRIVHGGAGKKNTEPLVAPSDPDRDPGLSLRHVHCKVTLAGRVDAGVDREGPELGTDIMDPCTSRMRVQRKGGDARYGHVEVFIHLRVGLVREKYDLAGRETGTEIGDVWNGNGHIAHVRVAQVGDPVPLEFGVVRLRCEGGVHCAKGFQGNTPPETVVDQEIRFGIFASRILRIHASWISGRPLVTSRLMVSRNNVAGQV